VDSERGDRQKRRRLVRYDANSTINALHPSASRSGLGQQAKKASQHYLERSGSRKLYFWSLSMSPSISSVVPLSTATYPVRVYVSRCRACAAMRDPRAADKACSTSRFRNCCTTMFGLASNAFTDSTSQTQWIRASAVRRMSVNRLTWPSSM
jgi:hypothetical protein